MNLCENSTDPYIRHMSEGPVKWLRWDAETLERAVKLDRPICLCVINNSSRWSHAMKDSFDHPEIVKMLNNDYIPVMADCLDAPQLALASRAMAQIMMGHAGWPLLLFLSPSKKPIFASSYLPRQSEDTRVPGLLQVLRRIKWLWLMKRTEIDQAADSYAQQLAAALLPYTAHVPSDLARTAAQQLLEEQDPQNGGFGGVPKFPQASKLLLAAWLAENGTECAALSELVDRALRAISRGGLHDHLDGGFHDYCLDSAWKQPNLGKHLDQNAALLLAYAEGGRLLNAKYCTPVIARTLKGMKTDGLLSNGDDAEQDLGSHYLWSNAEIDAVLGETAPAFRSAFGATKDGNYKDPLTRRATGKNIFAMAAKGGDELDYLYTESFSRLSAARSTPPSREARAYVRGNAVFAAFLARLSRQIGKKKHAEAAERLTERLLSGDGCHAYYDRKTDGLPTLDDIAALAWVCIELYRSTQKAEWLARAEKSCLLADELFGADGAMSLTAAAPTDIVPAYDGGDDILPSGNGMMLNNLVSLASVTGEERWKKRAASIVGAFGGALAEYPTACAFLTLGALRLKKLDAEGK